MKKEYPYQNLSLNNIKGEEWKDIPGLEMYAQISNYGRIKRLAYELEYNDGRIFFKPARVIKPVVMKVLNAFKKDHIFFLRATITLFKLKYNLSIARLVYHCFTEPIDLNDETIVILPKDRNGLNIKPSNLLKATLRQKQKRIFDLNRREPLVPNEEARERGIAKSKQTNNKEVTQYTMHGEKIKTFPSVAIASAKTNISHSHISNRARGIEFSAGGFIWRFGNAPKINIAAMEEIVEQRRRKNKEAFGKKVTQYSMDGKRIATFPTINDASLTTGINRTEISKVTSGKRNSAGGFFWRDGYGPSKIDLSNHEFGEVLRAKRRMRPVMQYSRDGKPLQKFDGVKIAAEAVGVNSTSIIGALTGKQETSAGYKWKYLTRDP